jgi:simple sugar transport system permease protein
MDTVKTSNFVAAARLPAFLGTRIHLGIVIGLVLLLLFRFVIKRTRWGLEMRAIGGNPEAARRNGIPVKRYYITVLCAGGAIAGLAGMAQVSGFYGVLLLNFSTGLGFMGFLICWLAGGEPVGIILMSFVVAAITTGGGLLQLTRSVPYAIINVLLAFALFVVLGRPAFLQGKKS